MRRLWSICLAAALLAALCACGSGDTETTAATDAAETTNAPETQESQPEAAVYDAVAEFSGETADGLWVYGFTDNGYSFVSAQYYDEPDWDGDGERDAAQWYYDTDSAATGVGINYSFDGGENWIEINNNGSDGSAGLGFKAPADGTYVFSGQTWNQYGAESSGVIVNCWESQLEVLTFTEEPTDYEITITLSEGDVVYFWVADEYSWVSAYVTVTVTAQ